ncbi:hypothetical protein M406DRAFT_96711 [Cryphonectria parasitica EP155]|uniref:DUF1760-domain-containing protein n=1 Tax=Cryphonectria parasitica (strain ATCC 38755 / EP155) TaxID=660469 RepID=A0A9P4YBC3_CRYP1|nr:uncharacterized protein M406DRAFT_96711 [Cryphonectria parasitica EP155]KAF3770188.1 hypothetical protein M406DRAFT_96711 [Cryphonectria parasitica EP155]
MADASKAIEALTESRPPATDRFTYLTIIEKFLSPEILPRLNDILQDARLTQEIGWDLVEMLVPVQGCEPCLETVARLGNPRETIIKVLEIIEGLQATTAEDGQEDGSQDTDDDNDAKDQPSVKTPEEVTRRFIILLGMLAILHKRIRTKYPSRFLATSLLTVYKTYQPNQEMTASIINLVHSLSGLSGQATRPPLPMRKSSIEVANPDQYGDASKNAPDPEADHEVSTSEEAEVQRRLLLSFTSCVLESYVNANDMQWTRRLLEFYNPDKIVPGRKTATQAFREDPDLANRDTMVGKLVALTQDLGLSSSTSLIQDICTGPVNRQPLRNAEDVSSAEDIGLSTGGTICLLAYWVFSSTVFEADHPRPEMHLFPDHHTLLENYLGQDAQSQILQNPASVEAILVLGLWLQEDKLIAAPSTETKFMSYHHALTLCAVFHPSIYVRNAAVTLAGLVLHDDPDDAHRLKILEDLLENCVFASLKACALTWLREELIAANKASSTTSLQYHIFPNLVETLEKAGPEALLEYWTENSAFLLQAANFAYFLFSSDVCKEVVPEAMGAAVEQRYVEPLLAAARRLEDGLKKEEAESDGGVQGVLLELDILQTRLTAISLH